VKAGHVHLVGIGGIGMSAIARVLLARGVAVSGSDQSRTPLTEALSHEGARVFQGHRAENVGADVELVVMTSAVGDDNPEIEAAAHRGIRVVKRREFLAELTEGYRTVAIAGSHGKSTTTALIGLMLVDCGMDPTLIVGGIVTELGSNAREGNGEYFVIEADEYGLAFLGLNPHIAVVTNVDYDHPDLFPTLGDYRQAFVDFVGQVQPQGHVVACGDNEGARRIASSAKAAVTTYGLGESNVWRADGSNPNSKGGSDFKVFKHGQALGEASTRIGGPHNVANALGAIAAANIAGVPFASAVGTLERFGGVGRRFQNRGEWKGIALVDDYAHHPSEIRATLAAARELYGNREIWAVFQPHTYSRTKAMLDEFSRAFDSADHVIITEIYPAREEDTLGMSGIDIVTRMNHGDARFIAGLDDAASYLTGRLASGDVLITLGAGDVNRIMLSFAGM
jgi:UDP-N-acetylmuramate--alanine ligase